MATAGQIMLKKLVRYINDSSSAQKDDVECFLRGETLVVHGTRFGKMELRFMGVPIPEGHCWTCGSQTLGDTNFCSQHDPEKD